MEAANSLPEEFLRLLEESVGKEAAGKAAEAFRLPSSVSVRANPAKTDAEYVSRHFPGSVQVPWCREGLILPERPSFTADPLLHCGAYYVQDSSAMFPGYVFRKCLDGRGFLRVLDLCAAPGGKTTDIAAALRSSCGDNFILVSNEVMRQRASVLAENVARWGDPNVVVTSVDASAFSALPGWFDIIVADVPCSGEGMFRKDAEALRQWSPQTVDLCAGRQRRILADVWPSLREGGILVYSTCTFNNKENDGNVEWTMEKLGAESITIDAPFPGLLHTEYGHTLLPGFVPGEGQYCAALRKTTQLKNGGFPVPRATRRDGSAPQAHITKEQEQYVEGLFTVSVSVRQKGDLVIAVPEKIAPALDELSFLRPLMSGTAAGTFKGKDFIPSGDLALSTMLSSEAFPVADTTLQTALRFLRRDAITLPDSPVGLVIAGFEGQRLGFVKNLGRRCNNLLPAGRRIRMEI